MSNLRPEDWKLTGEGRMTDAQRRMLNAVCGDLAKHLHWKGSRLDKDEWRHLMSAVAAGQRMVPGWDYGDGRPAGIIMLGRSSLTLTKSQAADAITMAVELGDDPTSQGMYAPQVQWCDAVLWGLGFNPNDIREAA